jgi:hypothetical protein
LHNFLFGFVLFRHNLKESAMNWDADEPPASFDDPSLPSFAAYGTDFFRELFGGEVQLGPHNDHDMTQIIETSWSLEELGYNYDAPHVHSDGRIEDGLHPPDYYAYSPHTNTWQDGLKEIEEFDWSGTAVPVREDLTSGSRLLGPKECPSARDVQPASSGQDILQSGAGSEEQVQRTNSPTRSARITPLPPPSNTYTVAVRTPSDSPPRIPEPYYGERSTSNTVTLISNTNPSPGALDIQDEHDQDADGVSVEAASITAQIGVTEPEAAVNHNADAQHNQHGCTEMQVLQVEPPIATNPAVEGINETGSDMTWTWIVEHTVLSPAPLAPTLTGSTTNGLMSHNESRPIATQSPTPIQRSTDAIADDVRNITFNDVDIQRNNASVRADVHSGDHALAQKQSLILELQQSTINDVPHILSTDAHHDNAPPADTQVADTPGTLPQKDQEAKAQRNVAQADIEVEVAAGPPPAVPAERQQEGESPAHIGESHQWKEQLQDAIGEPSCEDLPEHLYQKVGIPETAHTNIADGQTLQGSSSLTGELLEEKIDTNILLPPSPFQSNIDTAGKQATENENILVFKAQDSGVESQKDDLPTPPSPEVQTPSAEYPKHTAVKVADEEGSCTENTLDKTPPAPLADTGEVLASELTSPTPELQATNFLKRSKPAKKTKLNSDSEQEAPLKKKPRKSAAAPKSRATRTTQAFQKQDEKVDTSQPKPKHTANKSKKEARQPNKPDPEPTSTPSRSAHFAHGIHVSSVPQNASRSIIFGTEAELQESDNDTTAEVDTEEPSSDVDAPVPVPNTPHLETSRATQHRDSSVKSQRTSKLNALEVLRSSAPTLMKKAVATHNENAFMLVKDDDGTTKKNKVVKRKQTKSRKSQGDKDMSKDQTPSEDEHETQIPPVKKGKKKSPIATTPTPQPTPNKYGFAPPRGPRTRSTKPSTPTLPTKRKLASKPAAAPQTKKAKPNEDIEGDDHAEDKQVGQVQKKPSPRRTRRASALEEEILKEEREESEKRAKEKRARDSGAFRAKLRGRGNAGG